MTTILVVDDSELNRKLVSAALQADGHEVHTAENAAQALEMAGRLRPSMAILDVMMPDMNGYELCRRLRQMTVTAHIPIMILTSLSELDEKLKAFEAGADDFLAKPFQPEELRARVKVLLRRATMAPSTAAVGQQGKALAIFSLRGGVGVSTLAVNLAVGLAQVWPFPVALVDLALVNGQSALMLDLPLRNTWSDLSHIPAEELDAEVIDRVLLRHDAGVHVLAAPRRPEEAELLGEAQVGRVLALLRERYQYLIFDLPHDFSETTLAALDAADQILLLLSPELAATRCASIALDAFEQVGYTAEKITLVLNWTFPGKGLPRQEIEKALGREIRIVIPYAAETLIPSLTLGKPPTLQAPNTPLAALFEDLAYFLSKKEHKQAPPDPQREGYRRVMQRAKARQQRKKAR
ncbi:MAG: response regulator [Anaerolineae bacterium]|nr:MAG: response regulator [Anaerolineae bacterium]